MNDPINQVALKLFYDNYRVKNMGTNDTNERTIMVDGFSKNNHKLLITEIDFEMFVVYFPDDRHCGYVFELHHLDDLSRNIEVYCREYAKAMEIDYESVFTFKK